MLCDPALGNTYWLMSQICRGDVRVLLGSWRQQQRSSVLGTSEPTETSKAEPGCDLHPAGAPSDKTLVG